MLFTFFKINNREQKRDDSPHFFNELKEKIENNPTTWISDHNEDYFIFDFHTKIFCKSIIYSINEQNFLLINSFDKTKINNITSFFSESFNLFPNTMKISTNSFKKIMELKYQIVELDAIIHDPIVEEISISGTDIHDAEFYQIIMEKGEIQKITIYFDEIEGDRIGSVVKLFSDSKMSVIPELDPQELLKIFKIIVQEIAIDQ